jgi:hypothetical protein
MVTWMNTGPARRPRDLASQEPSDHRGRGRVCIQLTLARCRSLLNAVGTIMETMYEQIFVDNRHGFHLWVVR